MKQYPTVQRPAAPDGLATVLDFIVRERQSDVKDFDNLQSRFMAGRKVGKIPTSSADVAASDRLGDFNYSASYYYLLVDNAGTPAWRRIALGVW